MPSDPKDFPEELGTMNHLYRAIGFARDQHRTPRQLEAISQPYQDELLPELTDGDSRARAGKAMLASCKTIRLCRDDNTDIP